MQKSKGQRVRVLEVVDCKQMLRWRCLVIGLNNGESQHADFPE